MSQGDLFAPHPFAPGDRNEPKGAVHAASVDDELRAVAARMPPNVYLGTSSWSFPGWSGIVYGDTHSEQQLARRGLPAYAAHPLFATVGLDRTFYNPVSVEVMADYAASVPAHFRFLVKAHEALTLARYPMHARYGAQRGQTNALYLDVAWARDQVVAPFVDGLRDKAGVLLFQMSPAPAEVLAGSGTKEKSAARRFAERMYRFLRDLPKGPRYAVEIRTPELITPDLAGCLRATGVAPCFASMPGLPPVEAQASLLGDTGAPVFAARWLLAHHRDYDGARAAYEPFNRLVEPDRVTRGALVELIKRALATGVPVYVIVNNKAEGSSPLSVAALARALVDEALVP
ncbi:MAG TPA: DUF72 domain-containing protein [Kofleriaceae bacterium]|nr:DUF72 domain-containing protein [Kofleriaceae bacterium]